MAVCQNTDTFQGEAKLRRCLGLVIAFSQRTKLSWGPGQLEHFIPSPECLPHIINLILGEA